MNAARIQAYIRTNATRGRDVERIGPFLATFSPRTANPYLNYAIPDADAEPTASDAAALTDAYTRRGLKPRLEFLPGLAPAVEPALRAAGFTVEARLPLMECPPDTVVDPPSPAGVKLIAPRTDEDLLDLLTAQHEVYAEPTAPTAADVAGTRRTLELGGLAVLARDAVNGEPAGGGICDAIGDGIGELAGFGVRARYRGRGVGTAITAHLTRAAHRAGAVTVFLTPGGEPAERIYTRVGFRRIDEVVFLSR